ncbi:hypothetical protein TBLA_0D05600 [Henningerozyma blattae CBS 6284]|uniref:Ribosome biogenesis protein ALB1 n=1 Tax=Henningerozyma blattae (strain ATCC 34711 / CBS 6284 / DSM 70876 / NBRC 10599 / NRRL Y-10934 / UCD 77-7) TaxID=1071380 RepID=I2H3V0_HENB6|nr:hypothetical protein TBLA_0D05600 [Tetrapisispora blattae CBS 6284]CCH61052.1 hypothetical protein TBLA_0D05600 [Tetrapisispora blattae CBS 6284]
MPSKNSVNRRKYTTTTARKQRKNASKRLEKERLGLIKPARSARDAKFDLKKSVPLDLYFNGKDSDNNQGVMTTKSLSKKRTKKIERMLNYVKQRKDRESRTEDGDEDMDVDQTKRQRPTKETSFGRMKNLLWDVVVDQNGAEVMSFNVTPTGDGTTLGGPFFP